MRFLLALCVIASTAGAQTPIIGLWPFDESTGVTTADVGPFGNQGSLVNFTNNPAQWVPGKIGNALSFDGSDDYVDVQFNGGLPFYTGYGAAFSVCFWANGTSTDDDRVLSLSSASSTRPLFTLGTGASSLGNTDKLRMYLRSDNNVAHVRYSTLTVFDNTWHHVAYVEHAGEARVYVDGVLDPASFYTEPFNDPFTLDRLTLGAVVRTSLCCAWPGAIDDLQIYGFPLTSADVATVMGGGIAQTCRASFAEYGTGCGPGPLDLSVAGSPALGGPGLLFAMRGGPPNGGSLMLLGAGGAVPLNLTSTGFPGCWLYPTAPVSFGSSALNSFGASSSFTPFPLPSIPALSCLTLTFQSVAFSPSILATSDAVLVLLGI